MSSCHGTLTRVHIGTHDIQNVTVNSPLPGQIRVTGDFVDGTKATGVLLIIYSLANSSDIRYISKETEQGRVSVLRLISFLIISDWLVDV